MSVTSVFPRVVPVVIQICRVKLFNGLSGWAGGAFIYFHAGWFTMHMACLLKPRDRIVICDTINAGAVLLTLCLVECEAKDIKCVQEC